MATIIKIFQENEIILMLASHLYRSFFWPSYRVSISSIGINGQFLLTLSSGSNSNITIFGYDGWRFYLYDQQPQFPAFVLLPYNTYSFNVNGRTMYIIESRGVEQSNQTVSQNLFEVEFVKAFPRFTLMNETLSKVRQMNRTLDNLMKRTEDLKDEFIANQHRMVLLNGTNNVTGKCLNDKHSN